MLILAMCVSCTSSPKETKAIFYNGDFAYAIETGKATIAEYTGSDEYLLIPENSYAHKYALANGITFVVE